MRIQLPYGTATVSADLDWGNCLGTLDVAEAPAIEDLKAAFERGMEHPIGLDRPALVDFRPGEPTVIVVSDSFRRTRIEDVLPFLMNALERQGVRDEDISFLVSTGTHRGPTPDEARQILGEALYARFSQRLYTHDPHDAAQLVDFGRTRRGTPIALNRRYVEATRRIVTGTVVLHYFGGFGGGRKSIMPGLASAEAVAHNHALNLDPDADRLDPAVRIGVMDGNPVAEDMAEAARYCPPDLLVNTVLNRAGAIAGLYIGEMDTAHRDACAFAAALYLVPIREQANLVIASAGNAKNYLQSHKALFNAYQAMKPGGRIIFLAHAPEGLGGNKLADWLRLGDTPEIMAALRRAAEINGQTALSTREKGRHALMVSALSAEDTALIGARKADTLEAAMQACRDHFEVQGIQSPTCYLMPSASHTVPVVTCGST